MASNRALKKIKYALRFLPDKAYIQLYYFAQFKRFCDLKNPKTYNEKLQWLKLYDRNPLYTRIVDKYEAKTYVSEIIGSEYCIPNLGIWDSFDDIDFDTLPDQFVLKCTHDSEGVVIVKDKNKMDFDAVRDKLTTSLNQNFYYIGREWPYKNVKPRIIAEQYMEDTVNKELRDYKFFCFNGEPKLMFIASGRNKSLCVDYFDMNFNHMEIQTDYPNSTVPIYKPKNFEKMIQLSCKLASDFPHIRVDWYEVNGKLYFGELTLYHHSGFGHFHPPKWNRIMGDWLSLPKTD